MQLGEGIVKLVDFIDKDENESCDFKPKDYKWQANLSGSGTKLGDNLGNKPHASCVDELSRSRFPSQAHHLIPNASLNPDAKNAKTNPPHPAHQLLIKGEVLYDDTDYDINHKNNGKWMPYAYSLKEWRSKSYSIKNDTVGEDTIYNQKLMALVMDKTKIQMHQGSHTYERYGVGEVGYLTRVDEYLDKIDNRAISHYDGVHKCDICNRNKKDGIYPPRINTLRYFDQASKALEKDIAQGRIFVSKMAAEFEKKAGFYKGKA